MILKLYAIFTVILSPFIDFYLLTRKWRGKEDRARFKERFGHSTLKRPEGKIIWVQSVSVGESNSALPLIEKLITKYDKKITILITTTTITSAKIVEKKIAGNPNIIHQYSPVDKYFVVKRFLNFWKPEAFIMIESEIWPNMISLAHKYCKKVMIVNAKMSERSFGRWKKMTNLKESIFDSINICYPQSEDDQYRFINLGIQNTLFLGNLKFDIPPLKVNSEYLGELKKSIGNRPMVMFASVHKQEMGILFNIFKSLKEKNKDVLFIMALRHATSVDEFSKVFNSYNVAKKSANEMPKNNTEIYVYDEMGEMGTLFELSKIVLMCGSLVDKIGGHTPIEPAKHNCAILTGPYIFNSKSLFNELTKNNACFIAKSKDFQKELIDEINKLLNDKSLVDEMVKNAKYCVNRFGNIVDNLANNIYSNIENKF